MAGVGVSSRLRAQTPPPRPAVSVTQQPALYFVTGAVDLNEDGRLDLIGATDTLDLQVVLGRGDGTFNTARSLGQRAYPLGVGDLNGDGHADLVITVLSILPGRGDGTFGTPRVVDSTASPDGNEIATRVLVADFNGDRVNDLAFIDEGSIAIYPGHGDFTFGAPVHLTATEGTQALVAADFNTDGLMDIAAVTPGPTLDVFLNRGALMFTASSLTVTHGMWDIAAGDINKDGKQDLVVTVSDGGNAGQGPGAFHLILGNGNGTFQASVAHATGVRGATSVAVGDFNHDGHPDVATGNRSALIVDTNCTGFTYWDSVTIAPGSGNGTFGEPATFRLGAQNWTDEAYKNRQNGLVAGDLNGDGWTDLVSSPGATLLSRAPVANRNPTVGAGPDQTIEPGQDIRFDAYALDPDGDWLDFEWRDASGRVVGPNFDEVKGLPFFCSGEQESTYTVTVTDRRGGSASDAFVVFPRNPDDVAMFVDRPTINEVLGTQTPYTIRWSARNLTAASQRVRASADNGKTWATIAGCASLAGTATECLWNTPGPASETALVQVEAFNSGGTRLAFDASDHFRIVSGPSTALPFGWQAHDVGRVGAAGSSAYDGTTFTVKGAGSDIWGTADEFHWALTVVSGDFDLVARVTSVQNISQWTKAGLMVREQLDAGARHASVFVTPTTVKGIAFQRRPAMTGTSVSTAGPSITAPVWLRLARAGNQVTAYYRTSSSGAWTLVGTQVFASLSHGLLVGLAVSSHVHGTLATAAFDNVQVIPPDTHLPPGWDEEDVGSVGAAGSAEATVSAARVTGSGADIWGTADEFHWAFRSATGDFSIEALVDSVENVNRWTKAGLMIRADSTAGAQHASVFATPTTEKGAAFQGRPTANGPSIQQGSSKVLVAPSVWLRLTRRGPVIDAYFRKATTDAWVNFGQINLAGLPATVKVGLAVSSHVDGTLATARFSQIAIEPVLAWATAQIGPGAGSASVNGTFFAAENRGADIWGTSDAFTYLYTRWSGDGALTARLTHLDFVNQWTKGGVMVRESLAPGSAHAFVLASAEKGLALQYRASTNGPSASGGSVPGRSAPGEFEPGFWLLIVREGDVFKGYLSTDKMTWNPIGQAVVPMATDVFVGIAVTSHDASQAAQGHFDDVTLRRGAFQPTPTPPSPF